MLLDKWSLHKSNSVGFFEDMQELYRLIRRYPIKIRIRGNRSHDNGREI
jgi:hypothetical protein